MANWWEDNVWIEPVNELDAEQRLLARREREFEQKRQVEAEERLSFKEGLVGDTQAQIYALGQQIEADTVSPLARLVGQGEIADELNRNAAATEAAIVRRETNQDPAQRPEGAPPLGPQIPDWIQRNVRGGLRSVLPIVIGGRLGMKGGGAVAGATGASIGGTAGAIGTAMTMEGNHAITEGRDAGLEGAELAAYAASQAAIEGTVAGAFSAVGLGGAEAIFARRAISGGVMQAAKQAAARLGQEIPEEITTEIAHALAADYAGTRHDGLTEEALLQLAFDTTIQTIVTMGAMEGPRLAAEALRRPEQQPPGEQLTPERMAEIEEFQTVQAERERLAREQMEAQDHPGAMPLPDDNLSPGVPQGEQPAQQSTETQPGVPAESSVPPTAGETSNVPSVQPAQPREEVIQNEEGNLQQRDVQRDQEGLRDEEGGQGQVATTSPDSPQQDAGNTVTPESSAEGGRTSPPSVPAQDSSQGSSQASRPGGPLREGLLGQNSEGQPVYERPSGQRYVVNDGVEIEEKATLRPVRRIDGRIEYVSEVDPDARENRFNVIDDSQAESTAEMPQLADGETMELETDDGAPAEIGFADGEYWPSYLGKNGLMQSSVAGFPTLEAATEWVKRKGATGKPPAKAPETPPPKGATGWDEKTGLPIFPDKKVGDSLSPDAPPTRRLGEQDASTTEATPAVEASSGNVSTPDQEFAANRDSAIAKVKSTWGQTVIPREPKNADEQDQMDFLSSRGRQAAFVDGDDASFSGALDESTGFMLIAGNRDTNDIWRTIGHEMAHATELDKVIPVDSTELVEGRKKRLARAKTPYRKRLEAEPELLDREARADIVGEFMRDKAFRDKLSSENPTLWERLREAVLKVVGKWTPRNEAQALVLAELRKKPGTRKLGDQPAASSPTTTAEPTSREEINALPDGTIYRTETSKGPRFAIHRSENKDGYGDRVGMTLEEAQEIKALDDRLKEQRAKDDAARAERERKEQAKKEEQAAKAEARRSRLRPFLDTLPKLQSANAVKVMDKWVTATIDGKRKEMPRHEFVETIHDMGGTFTEVPVVDDSARVKMEQEVDRLRRTSPTGNENHPETKRLREMQATLKEGGPMKSLRRAITPDGKEYDVTKYEWDYGQFLASSPTTTAPVAKPQTTDKPSGAKSSGALDVIHVTKQAYEGVPRESKQGAFGPYVYVADVDNSAKWKDSLGHAVQDREVRMELLGKVLRIDDNSSAESILSEAGVPPIEIPGIRNTPPSLMMVRHFSSKNPTGKRDLLVETMKSMGYSAIEVKSVHGNEIVVFDRGALSLKPAASSPTTTAEQKIVAYHGAAEDFTEFDATRMGQRDPGYFGKGFYFTARKGSAQQYGDVAAGKENAGRVITAELDTSKFLATTPSQLRETYGNISGEELTKALQKDGYKGVSVKMQSGNVEHVAFDTASINIKRNGNGGIEPAASGPAQIGQSGISESKKPAAASSPTTTAENPELDEASIDEMMEGLFDEEYGAQGTQEAQAPEPTPPRKLGQPDLRTRAVEELRKEGKRSPSDGDIENRIRQLSDDAAATNEIRQDMDDARKKEQDRQAFREYWDGVELPPATKRSMEVGDIAQVVKDVERKRTPLEAVFAVAEDAVAKKFMPEGQLSRLRAAFPAGVTVTDRDQYKYGDIPIVKDGPMFTAQLSDTRQVSDRTLAGVVRKVDATEFKPNIEPAPPANPLEQLDKIEDASDFINELLDQRGRRPSPNDAYRQYRSNTGVTTGRQAESSIVSEQEFAELYDLFASGRDRAKGESAPEPAEPAPKPPTRIGQARDAVRKKKADLYKQWNYEVKNRLPSGLDAWLAKLAFDVAVAEIQDGTLTFAAYVENVARNVSADLLEKSKPYFESAWRVAHKRGMTEDPAGKFDDVLAAQQESQQEAGDNLSPDRSPRKLGDVDYGTVDSPNRVALGEHFAERFRDGASYARITDARKEAAELIGGTPKDGTQAIKAIDESIELGVVMVAREIAQDGKSDAAIYDQLVDLYSRQPNLGTRTSTSMLNQAYSTPAPLAFVANRQAGITQDDTVYDSSAGNGMLLIVGGERIANELNPDRVEALEAQGIETTSNDATEFTLGKPITALAINPPFGELKNEDGSKKQWNIDGTRTDKIDHAITLKSLSEIPDNGKVAIIIGAKGFEQRKPKENKARGRAYLNGKGFYDAVYDNYNVVDHYTVHGDLYSRQGAAFPVDVIIIEGRGASSRPKPYNITGGGIPQVFNSWQELKDAKLLGIERGPDSTTESKPTDDEQAGVPAETDGTDESGPTGQREGTGGTEQPADRGGRRLGDDESLGRPSETPSVPEQDKSDVGTGGRGTDRGGRDQQRPATNVGGDAGQRTGGAKDNDAGRDGLNQGQETVADEESEVKGDQYQTGYTPSSSNRAIGALIPNNHQMAVHSALDAVADRYGNIDEFVANELGIDNDQLFDAFSAEQVDALALGMARHKEGKAFILGDQTGVGKGRVAAGMMIYAKRQGFVPVFMTEKPTLYADMIRDMIDIGFSTDAKPFNPLMTNYTSKKEDQVALPDGRILKQTSGAAATRVPEAIENFLAGNGLIATSKKATKKTPAQTEEYDAIFTTYDQMKTVQGVLKERHMSLQQLSPKAFFVLDESHNAGGSAKDSDRQQSNDSDDPRIPVAQMVRDLIAADTAGVFFSSATFAKRHSVMDLYAKTGMTAATGEDGASLASAIAAGGVPLQQVVSQQLVESGAYLRRERSFDGVEFSPKVYDVSTEGAEQSAAIFRAINAFDKIKQQALEAELDEDVISEGGSIRPDWATGEAGMTSTNFSSILWNLTDQMLLATKADSIADEAIASLERGESPVIYVDSTMEAALNAYIEASGLKQGEQSDFSFRDLLQRYLERSREVLVQRNVEDPDSYEQVRLTDEQLGERGLAAFNAAQELIDNFDAALPASPIDWIRKRIEDAGYSFGEYTGRQSVMRYDDINTATLEQRPSEEVGASNRIEMVRKFNAGELDVPLFNRSGATGISMHASEKFANQKRRHMIIGQAAKNIDTFMQSIGRVDRTGQVVVPKFTLAMTNLPAEVRPASVLVKKLASLNANVTASDKGSVSFDIPDVMNSIGDRIVADYLSENDELNRALNEGEDEGLVGMTKAGTPKVIDGIARKASGRMAIMPLETQQEFWDNVTETFNDLIEELDRMGANPLSAQVSELDARTIESFPIFDGDPEADNAFERPAYIEKVIAKRPGKPMTPDEIRKKVEDFYKLPESAGEPELRKAAIDWQRATMQEAMDLVADRVQTIRELGTTRGDEESNITARIQREEAVLNEFASMIRAFAPGLSVSIWEGGATETLDVIPGVVLGIERKGKGGHPASMSKWRVEIAMGSPDRVMRLSLSQLRASIEDDGTDADAREQSQEGHRIFSNRSLIDDSTLKDFEESEVSTVETRYIGTGNILAAFNIFREKRGRVTFFRDNEGNLRRGVLLPRRFNVDQWAKERPVVMDDVNQIRQFLSAGNYLETPDRALNVMMIRGGLVVRAPKSKARGGKYTLNPTILEASSPQEFVSIGSRMEMVIEDPVQQDSVLESILTVAPLQATSEKELARRIKNGDDSDDRPDVIRAFAAPTAQAQPGGASGDNLSPTSPNPASPPSSQRRLGDGSGDNLSPADPIRQADIVTTWSRLFDVPIRIGGYKASRGKGKVALGIYNHLEEIVRMREGNAFNIIVASHEVGHHIDKKMNLYSGDKKKSKLTQLKKDDPKRHAKVRAQLQALDYDYPNATRVDEGIAEAVRQIITGTAKNARLAPEAVAWVEEQIMADPKFGPAMKQAVEQAKQYKDQGAIKRAQMVFGGAPMDLDYRVRRRNLLERSIAWVYKGFVERRYTLNLVDADIAAKKPLEPGEASIHEMVTVFDSRVNAMSAKALQDGIHTIDGEKISDATIPKAQELLKKGEYTADADAYMVARFGLTLPASYNFGMDRQDAQEYVDWVESDADRAPRWQEYHKLHSEYFNALVELEVRDGDLTREEADRIMGTNKDLYVPLMRVMGDSRFGKMIGGGGQMIELPKRFQRRTQSGSGRPVMPIIQQAVLRTRHHYSRVVRQQIHNKIVEQMTAREGLGKWLSRIDPRTAIEGGQIQAILQQLVDKGVVDPEFAFVLRQAQKVREGGKLQPDELDRLAEHYEIEQTTDIVAQEDEVHDRLSLEPDITEAVLFYNPDYRRPNGMYVIKYMRGDKPELHEVDPDFYDTLLGLPQEAHSFYISAADWINSKFKTGAVGVNTTFAVSELARNVQTFAVNSKYATGSDRFTKTAAWTADYVAAITHLPLVHKANELVEVYREWGGELYNYISPDAKGSKKTARRLGSSSNRKKFASASDAYHTLADGMEDMVDRVRVLAAVSDVGPRLAEAEAYLKTQGFVVKDGKFVDAKTGDPKMPTRDQFIKAMYAAADVTYNYRRMGKWIRPIERIFPFSNAAIQALDKRVRTYRETLQGLGKKKGPERTIAKQAFLSMMAITTMYVMIKWAMMDEEEDMDQWEKDGYLTVKPPGIDGRFSVAMSREHAWPANGALAGIRYFLHDEKDALSKYFRQELNNTLPFGASGAVGTSVEGLMNFDTFSWRPIEPNHMRYGDSAVSPKYRFDEQTTELSKFLGKANVLSPKMIDHLLNGFTGGAWKRWNMPAEKAVVPILQALGTAEKADTQPWSLRDVPGLRAVYRDNTPNASVNEFYDEMGRLSLEMNNMKAEGQVPPTELIERSEMLSQAADVMQLLRESSGPEYDSSQNRVAVARDVLGKSDHANYPNPFYTDIPEEAAKKIRQMVFNDLDNLSRDLGRPSQSGEQSDEEYADAIRVWEAKQDGKRKYWEKHFDSPIVQDSLKGVKQSKKFRDILFGRGKPRRGSRKFGDFAEDFRRFGQRQEAAREFLRFGQGAAQGAE